MFEINETYNQGKNAHVSENLQGEARYPVEIGFEIG